jgi:hypothetical protein
MLPIRTYTHEIAHAVLMNDKLSSWDREI